MRKVCRLAREVLDAAARELKPGVTTDYIDEVVHRECIKRDVSCYILLQLIDLSTHLRASHIHRL